LFMERLKVENNTQILDSLFKLLQRLKNQLSLTSLSNFIEEITEIYIDSDEKYKLNKILEILENYVPILKDREKSRWNKKRIVHFIENRPPLAVLSDIQSIADQENMTNEKVLEYLKSEAEANNHYTITYVEKNRKKMLEFDKDELLHLFSKGKINTEEFAKNFEHFHISQPAIFPNLINDLIRKDWLHGVLKDNYFYSENFLKEEILQKLKKFGKIHIKEYKPILKAERIHALLNEVCERSHISGVFTKDQEQFFAFQSLKKEIENLVSKNSVVDMIPYREKFNEENFLKLENFTKSTYFTPYFTNHHWLTNLGLTRIQQMVHKCEQIGYCNLNQQSELLSIPTQILYNVVSKIYAKKNGFWNKDESIFYYSKYIKLQIDKIQREKDEKIREDMVENLASELQIAKEEITKKVDEKLNHLAEQLKSKTEFEIKPILRDLQMDYKEFIAFIDTFEKNYIIVNGMVIFSQKRILEEEIKISTLIFKEKERSSVLVLQKLAIRIKCGQSLLLKILNNLISKGEINGFWIEENNKFITTRGIKKRMIDAKGFIDLATIIPEITPTEEQVLYLEKILRDLIDKGELKGVYNPETQLFQTNDLVGEANLNTERERFKAEISPYLEDMELSYALLKDILTRTDITPGDIDEYENILEENIKKILSRQTSIKRIVYNANQRLNRNLTRISRQTRKGNKKSIKSKRDLEIQQNLFKDFAADEFIAPLLNDFENWKSLILAIEQKAGQIVFLSKKIKNNPEDKDSVEKMNKISEYLGFSE
ncbi:MAG: hypothetical protein ACTSVL_11945, partial [Promethearchaeota archaeon]